MTRCLVARTAVLRIDGEQLAKLAFPAAWVEADLVAYAESVHLPRDETVEVVWWQPDHGVWLAAGPVLYLANPAGFGDYARGVVG